MGIRNKVTGEVYTITNYDPVTGAITGINNVSGNTDLGNVSNVYIGGGNVGEVLSTDGTGNLSWIPAGGGGGTGDITFVDTTISAPIEADINIQAVNGIGVINSGITFRPADTYTRWEQWGPQDSQSFTTADWTTGTYTTQGGGTIGAVEFTNATNLIEFVNSLEGVGQIYFSVNGGPLLVWNGSSASLTNITFYTQTLPDTDPTTVTTFEYYYSYYSQIEIDYDNEEFNINTNNVDLRIQTTNQKDIEIYSSRQATLTGNGPVSITNFSDNENVYITTDATNQVYQWQFGVDGNLRLPGNTFAVNYANGDPVPLGGGGANTGNVTFDDQIVIGTGDEFGGGGLYLAMGPTSAANLQYLRVRGGDYPTHIHLDTGNNIYYDQYFGDDNKYVKLENTGNIMIGAYQDGGPSAQWNFSYDGNLTVPGNIQSITTGFPFTSSIIGITTGSSTVIVTLVDSVFVGPDIGQVTITGVTGTTEADGTWYFESVDPSNFALYYDAELNNPVDGTTWTTYVSGGLAVAAGYSDMSIVGGNVGIVTNTGNTWTFGDTGLLTLPGGAVVDSADDNFEVRQANNINFEADSDVNVSAGGGAAQWKFGSDDILTIPGATYAPTSLNTIKGGYGFTLHPTHNTGGVGPELYISYNDGIEITPITNDYFAGGTRAAPLYIAGASTTATGKLPGTVNIQGGQNTTDGTYANVTISTGFNRWTFDTTGNLTIPSTSGGFIKTVANASIGIVALDNGTDNPAQMMSWNVGSANPTTIISAYASNATIQSNVTGAINTWEFDNTGNLTLADGGFLVVSGGIVGGGASPAPYLSGFSSLATVGAQGNITASGFFVGDGGYLSNIAGGNVVGEVALANTVSNPSQPNITSVGTLVSLTTGALNTTGQFTANGNAQFNQDVFFAGNVTLPGTINQISGNSASFFGDPATGFGALYVGIPTGYTTLDNEVAQFADNFDGYTQITHQNLNGGDQATGDFVITADNGTDLVNYIDLGMAGSGYDGALANNSLGTALYPNDGYLYTQGNVTGGNLVLGSNQTNGVVRIIANGASNIGDVVATFAANGLTVASNVAASYFLGNGSQLTSIAGSSVTGIVASASVASVANSIAGANVSGQVANAASADLATFATTANSVAGANVSGEVSFAATANSVVGANVSGAVASATVAASANSVAGSNVSGAVAFATTANSVAGANVSGTVASATVSSSANSVAGANVSGEVANALVAGTVYTASQPAITSVGTLTSLAVTGNITSGNVSGTTGAFTNVSGDGSALTALAGANVTGTVASATVAASANSVAGANVTGTVSAATTAGTVTSAAQANITSVGTLTALAISGVSNLNSVGNVIITGGTNGQVLTTNGSGNLSWSTVSGGGGIPGGSNTQVQFNDAGTFGGSANFTFNKTTDTFTVTGTSAATTFSGSGASLTTLNASNISSGTLAQTRLANAAVTLGSTALTLGSTVTTVAGLTSVTSTTFVGALTGAATSATTAGTVTTAAQPNITSTGTLTSLTVSGVSTLGAVGNVKITGGTTGQVLTTDGAGNLSFTTVSGGGGGVTSIVAGTGITIDPVGGTGAVTVNYSGSIYTNNDVQSFLNGTAPGGPFEGPLIVAGLTPSITGANSAAPVLISNYAEVVTSNINISGTMDIEPSEGTIQRYTLTGNITINGFTTAVAGTNVTLVLAQDATGGRTLTSTMKFLGGVKTLSTAANAIDVLSVFYDGVNYLATLGKGYA